MACLRRLSAAMRCRAAINLRRSRVIIMALSYHRYTEAVPLRMCERAGCHLLKPLGGPCPAACPRASKDRKPIRRPAPARIKPPSPAWRNGSDRKWRKLRAARLASEPLCRACLHGEPKAVTLATELHHIIPLSHNGPRLAWWNTLPLCSACHRIITNSDYDSAVRAALRASPSLELAAEALAATCITIVQSKNNASTATP